MEGDNGAAAQEEATEAKVTRQVVDVVIGIMTMTVIASPFAFIWSYLIARQKPQYDCDDDFLKPLERKER